LASVVAETVSASLSSIKFRLNADGSISQSRSRSKSRSRSESRSPSRSIYTTSESSLEDTDTLMTSSSSSSLTNSFSSLSSLESVRLMDRYPKEERVVTRQKYPNYNNTSCSSNKQNRVTFYDQLNNNIKLVLFYF
jgi:hypothetical protein